MKLKQICGVLAFSLLLGSAVAQTTVTFTSPAFEVGRTSTGDLLDSTFVFRLGSFGGFTPTGANLADWGVNFTALPADGEEWLEFLTQFSGSATLVSNAGVFSTSNQAYIWGYNTLTQTSGAEWVLFTNPSWLFPAFNSPTATSWDVTDSGTIAVVGFLGVALVEADPFIQTANVSPIPEPSTYAAIFGVLALGLVAYRRRRSAA